MNIALSDYEKTAQLVIEAFEKRGIEGHYVSTQEEVYNKLLSLLTPDMTISWGGSMTLQDLNIPSFLEQSGSYHLLDRSKVAPEEIDQLYRQALLADTYLMSSNAITLDGKLVNIDGTGNRIAALIYGPKQVVIIAGMNKLVVDEEKALERLHHVACPQNARRLQKNTPCAITNKCHNCLSPDCVCMQTVITRNSKEKGRIKVILVGETLGY